MMLMLDLVTAWFATASVTGEASPVELPAGSVLWLHSDLIHSSQSNYSGSFRKFLVETLRAE